MLGDPKLWLTLAVLGIWYVIARTDSEYTFRVDPRYWYHWFKEFVHERPDKQTFLKLSICLVMVVIMFYTMPEIAQAAEDISGAPIVNPSDNVIGDVVEVSPWLLLVVITAVPFFEEFMFRRTILDRFASQWSIAGGLVISSVLFGLLHYANSGFTLWAIIPPIFAGLVLGIVYLAYGLRYSIFVHVMYNVAIWVAVFG